MRLTEKIHLLKIDFEIAIAPGKVLLRFVNVIIILGEKITLVDTGVKGSEEKISDYIRQNGRSFSEIHTVILSHSHPDHIGSANRIKELTNCKILAHRDEQDWIENIVLQNKERPVPVFFNLVDHPVIIDGYLDSGQQMKATEGVTMEFIHSPGHSRGSLNILFQEDNILFTADSIPLKNDIPNYDNFPDLMISLNAIKSNKRFKTLLTSWTPPINNTTEIDKLINSGEEYLAMIDKTVKKTYSGTEPAPLMFCRQTVEDLQLPPVFVNPIVDKAFRSHLGVIDNHLRQGYDGQKRLK